MKKTKILLTGDWHCGHEKGLAAPKYFRPGNPIQRPLWKHFITGIEKYAPFDIVIANGDLIDGNGYRNSGVELLSTDRMVQSEMAISICNEILSRNGSTELLWYFTFGTRSHTGDAEDFELPIAKAFPNPDGIKNYNRLLKISVDGVRFHIRHHIGSSSSPTARTNSLSKEVVWRMMNENMDELDKVDVFIRSHCHYQTILQQYNRLAMTLPALQVDSDYGQRRCTGSIDLGFVVMEIEDGSISNIITHKTRQPLLKEEFLVANI